MEAIGLTASLIAILELCGKTILYIQTAKGGSKQKAQLMTEIQSLQLITGQLHDVSDNDGWKRTMEILAEPGAPLKLLEETLRSLVQKLGPNAGLRRGLDVVLWPFQEKEVNSILAMIERQKASLSLALENNGRLLQDRIASQVDSNRDSLEELKAICGGLHEEINTVKRSLEQSKARETLQWITKLNFGPRHDTILQSWDRKTGTGTWILRHPLFIEWTASKTTETKLWCHGIPGAGKSVIAAIIFDHLKENLRLSNQDVSVATLYCDHEQQAEQNLDELERSVLHQALADCAIIPESLQSLRNATKDGFSPSLSKLRSVIASSQATSQTLFVVIDALDEASEVVQDQLVDLIWTLPFREVRILCTSRTWPKFKEAFADSPQIRVSASDNDVEQFVLKKIEDVSRLRKIMGESTALRDQMVTKVLEKAKGSFLMAKHHVDELSFANTRKHLLQKLEKLPDKMQEAYELAMDRIRQQPGSDKTLAIRTMSLIFGAQRQLTIRETQLALATITLYKDDEDDESGGVEEDDLPSADIVVQCCQGLLILEGNTRNRWDFDFKGREILRASHYTTYEYFRQRYRDWFPDGQVLLATACCYYLSQPRLQVAIENVPLRNAPLSSWNTVLRFEQRFRFFDYSRNYWGVHFFEARNESPITLRSHVEGAMKSWLTNPERLARLKYFKEDVKLDFLVPFQIIRKFKQRRRDVNAVDDKGECLLYNLLVDDDISAAKFLLKLPSLKIDPMRPYFGRMLKLAIRMQWEDLTQRLIKVLALDKRLVRSKDGALSERLRNIQNDVITEFCSSPVENCSFYTGTPRNSNRYRFLNQVMGSLQQLDPQHDRALLLSLISAMDWTGNAETMILRFFFDNNLRLEATDTDGNNILHLAAELGLVDITRFLLKHSLNPDLANAQAKLPAQVAFENDYISVFLQLLSAMSVSARWPLSDTKQAAIGNSQVGRPRDDGYTSLLSAVNAENRTALCWVVGGSMRNEYEQEECTRLLLSLGTDVNWRDHNGMAALSHHLSSDYSETVSNMLLNAGADPTARDCNGMTPLHYAVSCTPEHQSSRLKVVKSLLVKGANAGEKDNSGISAVGHLIHSCGFANDNMIELMRALYFQHYDAGMSKWTEVGLKILWLLLGDQTPNWDSISPKISSELTAFEATRRLIELVKSEKDALEERYQSDKPLEWLGRTQIDKTIKENIVELLTLAGMM